MPSANVRYPLPLERLNPFYPGQFGVPGTDHETGLRTHSSGAVFYVDPNYPGVSDARDGTNPTNPLQTVGAALTLCQAYRGDVIVVMANNDWVYGDLTLGYATPVQENVTVTVPGVRIVGVGLSSAAGVYWESATVGGTCITVHATDVLIEGFAFIGAGTSEVGINATWDSTSDEYGDLLTVRHCFFDDGLDTGIQLEYSWYADIHNNMFDEPDSYGIRALGQVGDPAYGRIHHNWFYDVTTSAVSLPGCDRFHVYENTVYNNDAATNAAGTAANCMIDFTNGSRNSVHHNTLSCVLPAAVAWDYNACNTAGAGDAWIQNYLRDGVSVTNP